MTTKKAPLKKSVQKAAERRERLQKAVVTKTFDMDVEEISILFDGEKPANGCPVLIKSVGGDKNKRELKLHILKKDTKEGKLYATSMEPGKIDKQNDVTDEKEIEKMAHGIMKRLAKGEFKVDTNHDHKKTDTYVAESFIKRADGDPMFADAAVGSHCLVFKLGEEHLSKSNSITGISVFGETAREEVRKDVDGSETAAPSDGAVLRALRVKAEVGDIEVAQALGLSHEDYSKLEADDPNDPVQFTWTGDSYIALGKIFSMKPTDVAAALMNGEESEDADEQPPADGSADTPPDPSKKPADPSSLGKSENMDKEIIRKEKKLLKSGTIIVKDGGKKDEGGSDSNESGLLNKSYVPTQDEMKLLRKSILGISDDGRQYVEKGGSLMKALLQKDDIISTDFAPGGSLSPQVGRTLISLIRDQSAILKKINLHEVKRRDAEVLVNNFDGELTRLAPGPHGSGDAEGIINASVKVSTQQVDILVRLEDKTVEEYRDDLPGLEQYVLGLVGAGFSNKLTKGIFMGNSRTFVAPPTGAGHPTPAEKRAAALTLMQGYFDLAKNGNAAAGLYFPGLPAAQQISISGLTLDPDSPMEIMDAMIEAFVDTLPEFNSKEIPILLGPGDNFRFSKEIKQNLMGLQLQINGADPIWDGHPMDEVNYITRQNYMMTPYQNLGLAILNSASVDGGIKVDLARIRKATELMYTIQVDPFLASQVAIIAKA